ncbi:hypothetical protein L3Q82_002393 [Scortum barcoo]|uniref:Uncharacterized protein n=1 Tax=Scortum barcoo TaxID=214431 RepID=A0ACB8VY22_9TELE|nr:hypothetical protein L3Q82_002393 [Scortum barcoo]
MESVVKVKKSLRTPIRKLTSCVPEMKERKLCAKHRNKRVRGGGGRGGGNRKLREAMNAQKNAERAAMRSHFRRKYQLSENSKDKSHLRSVGGKVSLPCELSKIIHPESKTKDSSFNLLSAFQGLSFGTAALTGRKHSKTFTPTPMSGDSCRVIFIRVKEHIQGYEVGDGEEK